MSDKRRRIDWGNHLFNFLSVSDLAWRNAQILNVLHLVDFEISSKLNGMYFFQQEISNEVQKTVEIVKGLSSAKDEEAVRQAMFERYKQQLQLVIGFEKGMADAYDSLLEFLEERGY